jgi:hypothetical protein
MGPHRASQSTMHETSTRSVRSSNSRNLGGRPPIF